MANTASGESRCHRNKCCEHETATSLEKFPNCPQYRWILQMRIVISFVVANAIEKICCILWKYSPKWINYATYTTLLNAHQIKSDIFLRWNFHLWLFFIALLSCERISVAPNNATYYNERILVWMMFCFAANDIIQVAGSKCPQCCHSFSIMLDLIVANEFLLEIKFKLMLQFVLSSINYLFSVVSWRFFFHFVFEHWICRDLLFVCIYWKSWNYFKQKSLIFDGIIWFKL